MLKCQCYLNGMLKDGADGKVIEVTSPYDGSLVGTTPSATKEDVMEVLSAAQIAQKSWAKLPAVTRAGYVKELADILRNHKIELATLLTAEHGKTFVQAQEEIDGAVGLLQYAVESAMRIEGEHITSEKVDEEAWIQRVPYGVVVGIAAWNFPLALCARKIGNALVCGNSMVVKPPSETPLTVMGDADVEKAARCAVIAKYNNCGQICTCNERMYIHEDVYDTFKEKFITYSQEVVVGNPMDEHTTMGPKVSKAEVDKLLEIKQQSVKEGAKVLLDMTPEILPTEQGNWFYPAVLEVDSNDNIIMHEEIFGPMVGMMKISSLEQAIEYANDCEYGLSAYLFSDSTKNIMIATRDLEFGELYINRENGELVNGFHNGFKKSGLGGEDGKHGLEGYLQKKMVYLNYNY